jgi:hypothetical protein
MSIFLRNGDGLVIAASSTSADSALNGTGSVLRIVNTVAATTWIRVGAGAQTATTADIPIAAGATALIRISLSDDHIAVKGGTTGTVFVMRGEGT